MFNDVQRLASVSGNQSEKESSASNMPAVPPVEHHSPSRMFAVAMNMRRMSDTRRTQRFTSGK